jgi:hypothetical protein
MTVAGNYSFFCGNGNAVHHIRTGFFIYKAMSAVKRV